MADFALWAAIRTVKARIGTWVGWQQVRDAGLDVDRPTWAGYIGQARAAIAARVGEAVRPLNRRPTATEIVPYSTRRAAGFFQAVDVYVRDRESGLMEPRPYTIKTVTLRSRQSIIAEALTRYQAAIDLDPDTYPEEVIGAEYTGTFELVPSG